MFIAGVERKLVASDVLAKQGALAPALRVAICGAHICGGGGHGGHHRGKSGQRQLPSQAPICGGKVLLVTKIHLKVRG